MNHQNNSQDAPRVEFQVHFQTGYRGRKHLRRGACPKEPKIHSENLPRLTRLLALAHRWNRLIEEGTISDYAEIARNMGLSRARVTQIMDLLYLAPNIQEEILLPPSDERSELEVPERAMRQVTRIPDWNDQRRLWRGLCGPLVRRKKESDLRDN